MAAAAALERSTIWSRIFQSGVFNNEVGLLIEIIGLMIVCPIVLGRILWNEAHKKGMLSARLKAGVIISASIIQVWWMAVLSGFILMFISL